MSSWYKRKILDTCDENRCLQCIGLDPAESVSKTDEAVVSNAEMLSNSFNCVLVTHTKKKKVSFSSLLVSELAFHKQWSRLHSSFTLENWAALRCHKELMGMRSMVTRLLSPLINHLLYWSADRTLLPSTQFSNLSLCGQTIPSWIAEVGLFEWMPNSKALFRFSFSVGSVVCRVIHCELILYLHCISVKIFLKVGFLSAF